MNLKKEEEMDEMKYKIIGKKVGVGFIETVDKSIADAIREIASKNGSFAAKHPAAQEIIQGHGKAEVLAVFTPHIIIP